MLIVLVRHAAVEADPTTLPSLWPLSDEGRAGARALAREQLWQPIERIFTSPELKALETAHIIAGPNAMTFTAVEDLREVERPANQWIASRYPGGYAGAVKDYLAEPTKATHGWEPPVVAQHRIRACIDRLRQWEPDCFAVTGHGQTLSLYVASVTGFDPWEIWRTIAMPDYAVIDPDSGTLSRSFGQAPPNA
jgi:broad specificity phosphatase PhoE